MPPRFTETDAEARKKISSALSNQKPQTGGFAGGELLEIVSPSLKEKLWHQMRHDLARYVPNLFSTELLMCPACGRLLPVEEFSIEHIVPQQALSDDPQVIKQNKVASKNVRGGTILLCSKPLKLGGKVVRSNGCNSWKGRWFDSGIRESLDGRLLQTRKRKSRRSPYCRDASSWLSSHGSRIWLCRRALAIRLADASAVFHAPKVPFGIARLMSVTDEWISTNAIFRQLACLDEATLL